MSVWSSIKQLRRVCRVCWLWKLLPPWEREVKSVLQHPDLGVSGNWGHETDGKRDFAQFTWWNLVAVELSLSNVPYLPPKQKARLSCREQSLRSTELTNEESNCFVKIDNFIFHFCAFLDRGNQYIFRIHLMFMVFEQKWPMRMRGDGRYGEGSTCRFWNSTKNREISQTPKYKTQRTWNERKKIDSKDVSVL